MNAEIIEKLKAAVGEKYVLTEDEATKPFLVDWTKRFVGKAVVVRPANTEEVSRVVRIANETRTPVVPQAGGTTLVGGSIPDDSGNAILLSLSRLNKIEDIDTVNDTVTVEAGVILEDLHKAVEEKGRFFPLSFGAKGSAEIGVRVAAYWVVTVIFGIYALVFKLCFPMGGSGLRSAASVKTIRGTI